MSGAIPPLPQYAFMAWCSVKKYLVFVKCDIVSHVPTRQCGGPYLIDVPPVFFKHLPYLETFYEMSQRSSDLDGFFDVRKVDLLATSYVNNNVAVADTVMNILV